MASRVQISQGPVKIRKTNLQLLTKILVLFFALTLSFIFLSNFVLGTQHLTSLKTNSEDNLPLANKKCTFYRWFDPDTSDEEGKKLLKNCSSCHMTYYKEWVSDKHSMSDSNPLFLSIYSGTDNVGNKDIYPGFKLDHPNQNGNCALCHNPEAALDNNFDVDLRFVKNKKTNGISCDFCHKIESVDQNPLKKGVAGLKVLRVCEGLKDIRFGPLKDPLQPSKYEELKYNSLYKTSLYCAECHDGTSSNTQIYSTFTEWLESPGAKKGVQCQSCHMKAGRGSKEKFFAIVDNPDVKHKKRPYYEVHSHSFLTEDPHSFRKEYLDLRIEAKKINEDIILVEVVVENNNFGHSFPTGSPMRNAVLLLDIRCTDSRGKVTLPLQIKGPRLPIYAGKQKGKPGKLYAKILAETTSEYGRTHGAGGVVFRKLAGNLGIPAQDWWNVYVASDTRIKAGESDVSVYEFSFGTGLAPVQITARLIWRNTWPGLAKIKGFELEEDLLIEKNLKVSL